MGALAVSLLGHAIAWVWLTAPMGSEPLVAAPSASALRFTLVPLSVASAIQPALEGSGGGLSEFDSQKSSALEPKLLKPPPIPSSLLESIDIDVPLVAQPSVFNSDTPMELSETVLSSEPEPEAYADIEMDIAPDGRVLAAWIVRSKPQGAEFARQALNAALASRFEPYEMKPGEPFQRKKFRALYESGSGGLSAPAEQIAQPPGARPPSSPQQPGVLPQSSGG